MKYCELTDAFLILHKAHLHLPERTTRRWAFLWASLLRAWRSARQLYEECLAEVDFSHTKSHMIVLKYRPRVCALPPISEPFHRYHNRLRLAESSPCCVGAMKWFTTGPCVHSDADVEGRGYARAINACPRHLRYVGGAGGSKLISTLPRHVSSGDPSSFQGAGMRARCVARSSRFVIALAIYLPAPKL